MIRNKLLFLYIFLFITASACELSSNVKEKLLNGFLDYLAKVPEQRYNFQDASLKSIIEIGPNTYKLEVQIRDKVISGSSFQYVICSGTVHYNQDSDIEIHNNYQCQDNTESNKLPVNLDHNIEETSSFRNYDSEPTIESTASSVEIDVHRPVKLDNEVQTEPVTSGEQFIAIRRDQTPCIGCSSQVNPDAEGVVDLAILGVNQLNFLESNVQHKLNKVVSVERQVQVVNGIRYILTMLIDYNSCTESEINELCAFTQTCKVAVLDKPWARLPNGSKYRVVVSNNCTKSWLFDENDKFIYDRDNAHDPQKPTPDYGNSPNVGAIDDIVKAVHNKDIQAQPEMEKALTDEEIKNIEQQIISNDRFDQINDDSNDMSHTNVNTNEHSTKIVSNIETVTYMSENPEPSSSTTEGTPLISEEKKKAIDELLHFFNYAGFKDNDNNDKEVTRLKRSFDKDLKLFNLAETFNKMRKSIDNAKIIYNYAQSMVDYLNENDMNVKNRILSSVLSAEEELSGDKHFFYIQAHIVIPCEKVECDDRDSLNKICNGIINTSIERNPQIISTFCYNDKRKKAHLGKITGVPVNDPLLLGLADTALKYIENHTPDMLVYKIIKILSASTQKTSGRLTRISMLVGVTNCTRASNLRKYTHCNLEKHLGSKVCEVDILERKMLKEKEISYVCTDRPIEESFTNMGPSKDVGDPDVLNILQEALQLLEVQSNKKDKQVLLSVNSVSTKLIAGLLTNIEFIVGYTTCDSSVDVSVSDCLLTNEPFRHCNVEVWQRAWLIDGRQITVSCENELIFTGTSPKAGDAKSLSAENDISVNRLKSIIPDSRIVTEKDSTDPQYTALAKESLQQYLQTTGSMTSHSLVKVDKVTTQVVSGLMTTLDFTVTNDNNDFVKCHSKVLEQVWLNQKEIDVDCKIVNKNNKVKRQVPGGLQEQDINNARYKALAEESLQKYVQSIGSAKPHKLVTVDRVTTQVVSGLMTRLDFTVTNDDGDNIKCHSKVWEQVWLNKKEIDVNCRIENQSNRVKRQVPGGLQEQNTNDARFKALAEESIQKYVQSIGSAKPHRLVTVDKVTTQVVSGLMTRLEFTVTNDDGDSIKCHSKVWEQVWLKKKEIDVDCRIENTNNRRKRQTSGGLQEQDASDARFKVLAEESLQKYTQTIASAKPHTLVTVDRVTTQVVSGLMTRLDFTVTNDDGDNIKCHSKVWEQVWLNKKEINVNCRIENQSNRVKRQVPGGLQEQNTNDARFKALAEESIQKYVQSIGSAKPHRLVTVDKVTTQVVSGLMTRLEFTVTNDDGDSIKCHSKVWEQAWLKKKEIDVDCRIENTNNRRKRQISGGLQEQDASDARFKVLAEESLQKYTQTIASAKPHTLVTVDRVTTQVVSGLMTRLDFTVTNEDGDNIKCHSKVWEQVWLNKKEIDVNCRIENQSDRTKRQIPGGLQEQNTNDARYKALAEESLQKYVETIGSAKPHRLVTVDKVTTQVVSGLMTRLDFTVTNDDGAIINCHSKVWEQAWLKKKEIDVDCRMENTNHRRKRQISNGLEEQDANDARLKALAKESLLMYVQTIGSTKPHRLVSVDKVTTQIVSGVMTLIDFTATNNDADILKCHSNVWEQSWLDKKDIDVNCFLNGKILNNRSANASDDNNNIKKSSKNKNTIKRRREIFRKKAGGHHSVGSLVEQDPKKHVYAVLADESLRKHLRLQESKTRHKVLEVTRVVTKVVSGIKYEIDYTAVPTRCTVNVVDASPCEQSDNSVIYYCHAKIWNRPWMNKKNIDVSCIDNDDNQTSSEIREKRDLLGGHQSKDVDADQYKELAKAATRKYEKVSKTKYYYKVEKVTEVEEQVVAGFVTRLKFVITPTTCLVETPKNDRICPSQKPKSTLSCTAQIMDRLTVVSDEDISVICKRKRVSPNKNSNTRLKRNNADWSFKGRSRDVENDIDEDIKYYYAERAIQFLNERSNTDNLQKLITIHDIVSSIQMKTHMVRMYLETAYTYCLRHDSELDLSTCDELDGTSHRLCFAKIFPSDDDELIVEKVTVICDDEQDFRRTTGLSIPDLLRISLVSLEDAKPVKYKLVHRGEPNVIPSLHSHVPVKLSFVVAATNCSKHIDVERTEARCFVDTSIPDKVCHSYIWMIPTTKNIINVKANCSSTIQNRVKRELNTSIDVQDMLRQSLEKIEMSSLHRYKLRVLNVNSYSTKITTGRVTTIDFDVGYTNCLKHEWVDNETRCEFLEHLPRRHCISQVSERLWLNNGRNIEVTCQDDETPLESHIEFESAETATKLAEQALKHIEAKYPHPKKQGIVRIFSLEKQLVAGLHYRMKVEVGFTNCTALSLQQNCQLVEDSSMNRFCRVNVWVRSWTDHPPNYRVTCDFQSGAMSELYHIVQAEQLFYYFITTYRPVYVNDHVEMSKRFEIFKDNVKKIHELNTHEKGTATYAVTRFADLSYEEFKSKYLGLKPSLRNENDIPMMKAQIPDVQIPDSFDWRESGAVTDVKNQGSCGSCWAFSVTGNIEGQWKLKTGQLLSLSEQELVDCDKLDSGCDGGYMDSAYRAIEQLGGLETEDAYPYEGEDDKCLFNRTLSRVQISGAVNISSDETKMAKWLVQNGPISIGINANAMQFYVGGVSHPWSMLCNPKNLDHGVLLVGYGIKNYPLFHKKLPYWIVKNSWGPSWGEQGYYRVFRGDGTCGVNQMASSAIV